ncbi:MAG: metalloregulator ArsR/SmtB family transcription factor [candidate division Zixibacteria bacterium]|nr:metalloregulator ArsR/SmtB family transcription factor [candidate division Zixibacteria bacterium]MBU1469762.1 metalloregulator ArsR/SmtB family transcription factor [candidate division Zixibacteria bacterium]MBU2624970.1 metalloregulator ArsR/SmtB family transcription factor [candidate division Zixibacteria bacterium]
MQDFLSITKALSDENRVRVLMALNIGELCVCQIIELLNLAPSTVSKHMSILKQARLVEGEKDGKWVYYRLASSAPKAALEAIEWAKRHLVSETTIKRDAKNLRAIIRQHPVEVCRKQKAFRTTRSMKETAAVPVR